MEHDVEKVIRVLKTLTISSYKIAKDTGISDQTIQNYRDGKTKPKGANLKTLYKYLGIESKADDLMPPIGKREFRELSTEIFGKQILDMFNKGQIYPANVVEEKDRLINSLYKRIGKLESELERCRKKLPPDEQ